MTVKKRFLQYLIFVYTLACLSFVCIPILHAAPESSSGDKIIQLAQTALPKLMVAPTATIIAGKISLDLRNIDVVDALKFVSIKAGLNIVTTKSVMGRVTLMVENAPIQDVFDLMLRSNNLAYDKQGEIYNVMTQEEYKVLYGKSFSDMRQVKVFYLNYTVPEQAFSLLDMLKSEIGRVLVDPESGNVLVIDSPARIEIMEKILKDFEEKNTVKVFKLNYAKAKDVEEALRNQLDSKKVGMIKADERGNQILVQTLPKRMDQIEKLIKDLDQKTKEIIVDINIVNVKLSDETSEGIQWEGLFDLGRQFGMSYLGSTPFASVQASTDTWTSRNSVWNTVGNVGSYPFSGTTTNYSSSTSRIGTEEMHLGVVGKHDFDTVIKYLQTIGKTKVVSNPKLAVVNNQEAKIHVGQKEAYVTTTTTTGQTTNTVSEQVTFVDVGVIISVVPSINDEGFITLKIKAEINSVLEMLITPTKNQIPIIDTSLAETTVMVKDGSTVIIGGLRKETEVFSTQQTPILGDIPLLGRFFSVKSKSKDKAELLIILTPKIISGEVLVSGTVLKEVGGGAVKPPKDYTALKKEELIEPAAPVFMPVDKQRLEIKGPKSLSR
ncbi:MAG: secretin N-terminal domain-containing protein [Candidatus Omnitrophota bacterium]|jgi:type II secretory pathway component GspD/PulD (secretin)